MKLKIATTVAVLLGVALSYTTGVLKAQLPIAASTQFDITGFLQEATLDPSCAASAHCGGTLKVNGHIVTVPKETIVILPANALTWQELFAQAPAPYTGVATGMAIADLPAPLTTYEVHVVGNRVIGATDQYIAGLIDIAQNGLNSGAGFINYMDYGLGEMRVGGVLGDPTTGTRVRLNDPAGRFGRVMTPDQRFTVDADNPTIQAGTGFPMCFPRVAPTGVNDATSDPQCPQTNRPLSGPGVYLGAFTMTDPALLPLGGANDPRLQAPFEVGDYVTFSGTLVTDNAAAPTAGPWPGTASTYVSAHTIVSNIAIFTAPGTNPAYISTEVTIIGTGGLTVLGAGEAAIRTRFEGMSTDPSRIVHLYGIDLDPLTGVTSDRDWGTIGVDPGPPNGAVKGRWRFRPPCTATVATDKACTPPPAGTFLPPTREVRAVIEGLQSQNPSSATAVKSANGIFYGQYHAPILEYIFPENIPGSPIVENNFNTIQFLAQGGYTSAAGTLAGQLNPWPSNIVPAAACTPPVASAGGPYTVAFNGTVTLSGSATGTAPVAFSWAAPASGTISPDTSASPVFNAAGAAGGQVVSVSLTASNACGANTATSTVTVDQANAPTVNAVAPMSVTSGANASFTVSGSDPNVPALTPLTFAVVQSPVGGGPALLNLVVTQSTATSAVVTYTAPLLPLGQTTSNVVNLTITATNTAGVASAAATTSVTINPVPDAVAITSSEYRIGKQRLTLTASTSVISANVVLTLKPYATQTGGTFDPGQLGAVFTNNGGGLYTLQLVGAPPPACNPGGTMTTFVTPCSLTPLVVGSNLGGSSPATALSRIRQ
jgi:hypothetical protein